MRRPLMRKKIVVLVKKIKTNQIMRKFYFFVAFLLALSSAFSQKPVNPALSKADYLKRSKQQKTAGYILLGGGAGLVLAAVATIKSDGYFGGLFEENPQTYDNTGSTILGTAGLAAMAGSVICFASAKRNAKKGAAITFGNQRIFLPQYRSLITKMQPALFLKITL